VQGNVNGVLDQVFDCRIVQILLTLAEQVFEMCFDHRRSLLCNVCHHGLLIVRNSLALDDADRPFRTGTDAGAKTVAEEVAHEPCLPFNELERSFGTVRDALAASRAFLFIDADDLPFHTASLPAGSTGSG
jgi:hypothetical protein